MPISRRPFQFGGGCLSRFADAGPQSAAGRTEICAGPDRARQELGRRSHSSMPSRGRSIRRTTDLPSRSPDTRRRRLPFSTPPPATRRGRHGPSKPRIGPCACRRLGPRPQLIAAQDVPAGSARRPHPAVDAARQAGSRFRPGRVADRRDTGHGRCRSAGPARAEQWRHSGVAEAAAAVAAPRLAEAAPRLSVAGRPGCRSSCYAGSAFRPSHRLRRRPAARSRRSPPPPYRRPRPFSPSMLPSSSLPR